MLRIIARLRGFTQIELMIVIVILGILSAFLISYFKSLDTDAKQSATTSIARALGIASSTNYALSRSEAGIAISITDCTQIANVLPASQPLPSGYTILPQAITVGSSATCTVTDGTTSATFIGHGV